MKPYTNGYRMPKKRPVYPGCVILNGETIYSSGTHATNTAMNTDDEPWLSSECVMHGVAQVAHEQGDTCTRSSKQCEEGWTAGLGRPAATTTGSDPRRHQNRAPRAPGYSRRI